MAGNSPLHSSDKQGSVAEPFSSAAAPPINRAETAKTAFWSAETAWKVAKVAGLVLLGVLGLGIAGAATFAFVVTFPISAGMALAGLVAASATSIVAIPIIGTLFIATAVTLSGGVSLFSHAIKKLIQMKSGAAKKQATANIAEQVGSSALPAAPPAPPSSPRGTPPAHVPTPATAPTDPAAEPAVPRSAPPVTAPVPQDPTADERAAKKLLDAQARAAEKTRAAREAVKEAENKKEIEETQIKLQGAINSLSPRTLSTKEEFQNFQNSIESARKLNENSSHPQINPTLKNNLTTTITEAETHYKESQQNIINTNRKAIGEIENFLDKGISEIDPESYKTLIHNNKNNLEQIINKLSHLPDGRPKDLDEKIKKIEEEFLKIDEANRKFENLTNQLQTRTKTVDFTARGVLESQTKEASKEASKITHSSLAGKVNPNFMEKLNAAIADAESQLKLLDAAEELVKESNQIIENINPNNLLNDDERLGDIRNSLLRDFKKIESESAKNHIDNQFKKLNRLKEAYREGLEQLKRSETNLSEAYECTNVEAFTVKIEAAEKLTTSLTNELSGPDKNYLLPRLLTKQREISIQIQVLKKTKTDSDLLINPATKAVENLQSHPNIIFSTASDPPPMHEQLEKYLDELESRVKTTKETLATASNKLSSPDFSLKRLYASELTRLEGIQEANKKNLAELKADQITLHKAHQEIMTINSMFENPRNFQEFEAEIKLIREKIEELGKIDIKNSELKKQFQGHLKLQTEIFNEKEKTRENEWTRIKSQNEKKQIEILYEGLDFYNKAKSNSNPSNKFIEYAQATQKLIDLDIARLKNKTLSATGEQQFRESLSKDLSSIIPELKTKRKVIKQKLLSGIFKDHKKEEVIKLLKHEIFHATISTTLGPKEKLDLFWDLQKIISILLNRTDIVKDPEFIEIKALCAKKAQAIIEQELFEITAPRSILNLSKIDACNNLAKIWRGLIPFEEDLKDLRNNVSNFIDKELAVVRSSKQLDPIRLTCLTELITFWGIVSPDQTKVGAKKAQVPHIDLALNRFNELVHTFKAGVNMYAPMALIFSKESFMDLIIDKVSVTKDKVYMLEGKLVASSDVEFIKYYATLYQELSQSAKLLHNHITRSFEGKNIEEQHLILSQLHELDEFKNFINLNRKINILSKKMNFLIKNIQKEDQENLAIRVSNWLAKEENTSLRSELRQNGSGGIWEGDLSKFDAKAMQNATRMIMSYETLANHTPDPNKPRQKSVPYRENFQNAFVELEKIVPTINEAMGPYSISYDVVEQIFLKPALLKEKRIRLNEMGDPKDCYLEIIPQAGFFGGDPHLNETAKFLITLLSAKSNNPVSCQKIVFVISHDKALLTAIQTNLHSTIPLIITELQKKIEELSKDLKSLSSKDEAKSKKIREKIEELNVKINQSNELPKNLKKLLEAAEKEIKTNSQ